MKKIVLSTLLFPFACFGAHPLITDDTDTQGQSNTQLEVNTDYSRKIDDGVLAKSLQTNTTLSYGLTDRLDIATTMPYQRNSDGTSTQYGVEDMSMELKWRFYENGPISLALKPGIMLPTGNHQKGLGNGRTAYSLVTAASYEMNNITLLGNLGYAYVDNKVGARRNIWNASIAAMVDVAPKTKLVLDVGSYRNDDPYSNTHPAFSIVGLIYSPTKNFDLDLGLKKGLNKAEVDYSWGLDLRFDGEQCAT